MKKIISVPVVALALVFQVLNVYAASNNASVGTKELLERIQSLENAVTELQASGGSNASVAGSSYRTKGFVSSMITFNQFPGQSFILGSSTYIFVFLDDGTGTSFNESCASYMLSDLRYTGALDPNIQVRDDCEEGITDNFTYTQEGNALELTFDDRGRAITVSNDGSVLMFNGLIFNDDKAVEIPGSVTTFDQAITYLTVGVRVDN